MRYPRLQYRERMKREKLSKLKCYKRKTAIKEYLQKNKILGNICKKCNVLGVMGAITAHKIRFRCHKCKKVWYLKIDLPKRFVPKKLDQIQSKKMNKRK